MHIALAFLSLTAPLPAQETLTLRQAVDLALRSNPLLEAVRAGERESDAHVQQARAAYLPRVQFSESFERSNNPVFVFTSLLTQRQFSEQDFSPSALQRSDTLNNFQSQLTVEQVLFDGRQTSHRVESAQLNRQLAREDSRRSQSDVILEVLRSYFGVVLAKENMEVACESVASAEADLARAETVYESGRSTHADVLVLRVYLATVREQQIRATNELAVARAALNDVLGVSLERRFELTTPLESAPAEPEIALEEYRRLAAENRAELRQSELTKRLAHSQQKIAAAAYWPEVFLQGSVEADHQDFSSKGGAYWLTGVTLRWSVWNGGETKARVQEARFAQLRAEALQKRSDSAIYLELRKAYGDLQAAAQRIDVASAASAEAEEAHRIVQNRHESGLTTTTELLRSEAALAGARTHYLVAVYDHRVAGAVLEHAAGTLSPDSPEVN